ncbi:cytochrome b/b6 domain-containing protein [Fulvimonas yonginensis]|uniref:Cytochrome b/b6 domain-containing protein n=1 Tax=Fulvimonas yonginensis TaxID=1495200 RepID=A0ABU8JF56_9GAMM
MNETVKVWDPLVRAFHWSLAALVLGNFLTAEGGTVHRWMGYAALALVGVRLVWGFPGTRHARFADWVPTPSQLRDYLRERLAGRSRRRLGHNPAASFHEAGWLEEVQETLALGLLALVGLHVLAPSAKAFAIAGNRVCAMITGRKRSLN